ncbi:MAG: trypsin-like peptidase domain-containing protein [Erysipelotrichaceae bacterium]
MKKHKNLIIKYLIVFVVAFSGAIGGNFVYNLIQPNKTVIYENQNPSTNNIFNNNNVTTSDIVKKSQPSVVEILTTTTSVDMFNRPVSGQEAGSGVIVSKDGYIVTNNHVVENSTQVQVTLANGQKYEGKVIGTDKQTDLAVIKIEGKDLPNATLGSSSNLNAGDYVIAIGNPLGNLGGSVSDGIISAVSRELKIKNQTMTLLQTNAAVNPGNSGGGLFNSNGELIGIVNAKTVGEDVEGIGFAIPIDIVKEVMNDLINKGYVSGRFTLGITIIDVQDEKTADLYQVKDKGVYIQSVIENSNAHIAGLQVGDRIIKFNGKDVDSSETLKKIIKECKVNSKVNIVVNRNGSNMTLQVTLNESKQ